MTELGFKTNCVWFQTPYSVHYFLVPLSAAQWKEGFLGPIFLICKTWELDKMVTKVCLTSNNLY